MYNARQREITPVILATQEAEIRRITVPRGRDQSGGSQFEYSLGK
jgi:hypothetical protein